MLHLLQNMKLYRMLNFTDVCWSKNGTFYRRKRSCSCALCFKNIQINEKCVQCDFIGKWNAYIPILNKTTFIDKVLRRNTQKMEMMSLTQKIQYYLVNDQNFVFVSYNYYNYSSFKILNISFYLTALIILNMNQFFCWIYASETCKAYIISNNTQCTD